MNQFIQRAGLLMKRGGIPVETRPGYCLRVLRTGVEQGMGWGAGEMYLRSRYRLTPENRLHDPSNPWAVSVEQSMVAMGWGVKTYAPGRLVFSSTKYTAPWGHCGIIIVGDDDKFYVYENSTQRRGQALGGALNLVNLVPLDLWDDPTAIIEIPEKLATATAMRTDRILTEPMTAAGRVVVTPALMRAAAPYTNAALLVQYAPLLDRAFAQYGITTASRVLMALANVAEESMWFTRLLEMSSGQQYEGKAILGNTHAGDGPRYKGRGFIQLTGRWNYAFFGGKLGLPLIAQPEKASQPDIAARLAAYYLWFKGSNAFADRGDFRGYVHTINPALNGLAERTAAYHRLLAAR